MNAPDPTEFRRGARAVLPLIPAIAGFGLVVGVAAGNAGFSLAQAVGLSVFVFAGASQLATIELVDAGAPLAVVVLTAVVINLRMMMYSASIAGYFDDIAERWRAGMAYLLTDQAYALSISHYGDDPPSDPRGYYLGVALPLWIVWQITTVVGLLAGASIPEKWGVTFAVPLVFLALLVPAMKDRPSTLAAGVGGSVAALGAGLPLNLGLLLGAVLGVTAALTIGGGEA
ncbi:AzlC family ABC transporter permease [Salarchaeum japonicum]|uniref:AzlC family ABC transporter permease n=1 Tax=Salarchaeum japonicum TaxID=555573 RepID=A0AAV3SY94_9EURY|nr:AzlC family ABC transporter permease [Salarchaeum japonicum]